MSGGTRKQLGATVGRSGVTFRVWAPFAQHVAVAVPYIDYDTSNQIAMERDTTGHWSVMVPDAEAGQQYRYLITATDGRVLHRSDPRSRAVTTSDNGSSIIVSNDFDWGDDIYMPQSKNEHILYELHVGTFHRPDASTQGTFYDAIQKLDYLADLGVTMVELMPVTSMSTSHGWGYSVSHLFAIENSYGGRHGLMSFVRACHERGIGVMVDVVYNHFGTTDMWQYDGWSENNRGGIYFYNDERGDTPWGGRPDLDRPEVRQLILDNVKMWFEEFRVDGLRLDSTSYLRNLDGNDNQDRSIPSAWSLLQNITTLAHRLRPGAIVVAEDTGANDGIVRPSAEGGAGCDAQWRLTFPEAIYQALGIPPRYACDIKDELIQRYIDDPFTRIVFSDSHDTAANGRARLNEVVQPHSPEGADAQRDTLLANCLVLTVPGIPMLFQGQEFMQDGSFTDWRDLDWEQITTYHDVVSTHQQLIALRRNMLQTSAGLLGTGINLFHVNDTDRVLGYHRWHAGGVGDDVIVLINFGDRDFDEYWIETPLSGEWSLACATQPGDAVVQHNHQSVCVQLPASTAVVLQRDA